MAGGAQELDDYVTARWSDLVRTARCVGAGPEEAERRAHDALVRSWRAWPEERRSGDVDVLVYGALLDLCGELDPEWTAQVLAHGAALSDDQVEDLVGLRPGAGARWDADCWEGVPRSTAPLARLHESVRAASRRRWLAVGALGVIALVTVAALVVLSEDRSDPPGPPGPPQPPSGAVVNPIPLAWWGGDVLHLARTTVQAPGLLSLAQSGADPSYAVVYGDDAGLVVQVEADGSSSRVGTAEPGSAILGASAGRVAWVDIGDDGGSSLLVLWDPARNVAVATLDLGATRAGSGARLLAVDGDGVGDEVLLRTDGGDIEAWTPGSSETRRTTAPRGGRVDTSGLDLPGSGVLHARLVDGALVAVVTRTYVLGRDYDDGITQSGRFPVADLVLCEPASGPCTVVQRRAQDVDPTDPESAIILPG